MTSDPRADLAEATVPLACDLIMRVRDADADGISRLAEASGWDQPTSALLVILAAMVDDSSRVGDLLAWTEGLEAVLALRPEPLPLVMPGRPVTEGCGTYAAWCRHKRHKEPIDAACDRAMRNYRKQRREARAA